MTQVEVETQRSSTEKMYAVKMSEILEAATFLSTLQVTLTIPATVCRSYRRTVAARKRYAARYSNEALGSQEGADGHIYFIWVLEESYKFLKLFLHVQSTPRLAPQPGESPISAVAGTMYDALWSPNAVAENSDVDSDVEFVDEDLPLPGSSCTAREQPQVYTPMINKKSVLLLKYNCLREKAGRGLVCIQSLRVRCEDGQSHYAALAYAAEAAVALIAAKESELHASAAAGDTELNFCIPDDSPLLLAYGTLCDVKAAWANAKDRTCRIQRLDVKYASTCSKALIEKNTQLQSRNGLWLRDA